jgi:hypothetical protein
LKGLRVSQPEALASPRTYVLESPVFFKTT